MMTTGTFLKDMNYLLEDIRYHMIMHVIIFISLQNLSTSINVNKASIDCRCKKGLAKPLTGVLRTRPCSVE